MTLATELNAVTESVRKQLAPETFATMEAGNRKLAASGLAERALKPGARMPDFELPDATGRLVRSIDLRAKGLCCSFRSTGEAGARSAAWSSRRCRPGSARLKRKARRWSPSRRRRRITR